MSPFIDNILFYIENLWNYSKKKKVIRTNQPIRQSFRIQNNTQKSFIFLHSSSEKSEIGIKKQIHL